MLSKYLNIEIGKKYNKLIVISYEGSYFTLHGKSKGSKYLCQCDCGNRGFYRGTSLLRGVSKQCKNCAAKLRVITPIKIGIIYGRLVCLSEDFQLRKWADGTNKKYYLCKCECGRDGYYNSSSLNTGRARECKHCAYKRRPQSTEKYSNIERLYNLSIVNRCKRTLIKNELSLKDFEKIIIKNCFYCGSSPTLKTWLTHPKIVRRDEMYANGVDRISSSEDYTVQNCVPCCKNCNIAKQSLSQEDFKNHIIKIYNYYASKKI